MQDPHTAEQQYYFCQGLLANGSPMINPETGWSTRVWLAGDPVTGEGWIYSDLLSPLDVRNGHSTGPFTMAPGDTQDIILGIVVGMGADNLGSITAMRFYDQFAQKLYDNNFGPLPAPPQPMVTAHALDSTIVLDWDLTAAAYEQDGYTFEGYTVWQGESLEGPWVKLKTFDLKNGITEIWDYQYSSDLGALIEMPVIKGSDEGLANTITITHDVFTGRRLINGTPYYFAVTSYAYNPDDMPRAYECSKAGFEVVPHAPVLDMEFTQDVGSELDAVLSGPQLTPTWGKAVVVDPGQLTGHEYRVDFTESGGEYFWDLTDVTTGEVKLTDQTNFSGDDFYNVVDGARFIVRGILPSEYGWDDSKGSYGEGWDSSGDRWITGFYWGGHALFGGMDTGEEFWGSTGVGPADYVNTRVDFWTAGSHTADPVAHPWSNASTYLRPGYGFNGVGVFPGAAYDVEDEATPRRLNVCFVEYDAVDAFWDPIVGQREYLFIMLSDYLEDPSTLYNDDNNGLDADALFAMWVSQRGSMTYADFSLYMYVMHPLVVGENCLTFDTDGWAPVKSKAVAKDRLDDISVFPNPYMVMNQLERLGADQFVTFTNLPADKCALRIFTLNGEQVAAIEHGNGTPFERWDLCNQHGFSVASGMYFVHISTDYGTRTLKLAVINRGKPVQ
ncbi:T9SS type A sorting domain-containing protein [bacterium]|nr:T9SS type A sorting domain-containing protein [bacterium]